MKNVTRPTRTAPTRARRAVAAACALAGLAGCHSAPPAADRAAVAGELTRRVGHAPPPHATPGRVTLPPGASFEDGLTEDEAVSVALWNNAPFQELLADLGIARGDLVQAGLLPNPELVLYFAEPHKAFRYLFDFALESVWLRPARVRAAARESDRTADRLAQAGLDLMRDTRQAYADAALAGERVRVAAEGVRLRGRVADLADARLRAGDLSPQEAATARVDALQAEQDAARAGYDVPILEERLRNLMGVGPVALRLDPGPPPPCLAVDEGALTREALMTRPDALAAAEGVAAAQARLDLARLGWARLLGIGDATSGRRKGNEFGPGLRVTVPVFNQGQGLIARAEGELERAARNQQTVANQVALDVRRAALQYRQACAELDVLRAKVRPEVDANLRRSQAGYREGNVTYLIVLQATQQLLAADSREAVLVADLRRFLAELERGVGRRLAPPGAVPPTALRPVGSPPDPAPAPPVPAPAPPAALRPPVVSVEPVPAPPPAGPSADVRSPQGDPVWAAARGVPVSRLQQLASAALTLALAAAVAAGAWWLVTTRPDAPTADKPPPAATVGKVVKEDDLNTVTLTEEAEKRLGLRLAAVETRAVRRVRVYGGEATVPAGRAVLVSAPVGGTLQAPPGGVPSAGKSVKSGQAVVMLAPILTPDGRATLSASLADADGQVQAAKAQLDPAKIALDRAERVLKEGAGSQRQVDEARAAFDVASKALAAAAARRGILAKVVGDGDAGTAAPVPIPAPADGVLRAVSALPGQAVPAGAALFEVADLSTLWVRVALPVNDLDAVDRAGSAGVGKLSAPPGVPPTAARPVAAPPSANPLAGTVDLYYEVPNPAGALAPGTRLGVTVPLADSKESLTVPWSAVVFDVHGGTWVYGQVAPRTYARRRVTVRHTAGADAVLDAGPPAGTKAVAAGAQELFGAETGFVK